MPRVKFYQPANVLEAHMIRGMLEQFGIEAQVHGDSLVGGVGELPAAGLLFISIPEHQLQDARQILLDYEQPT